MTNPDDPVFGESKIVEFNSGPAFCRIEGLSKREWYAGLAMQGFVAGIHAFPDQKTLLQWKCDGMAIYCLRIADALIAEMNKEKGREGKP